MINCTRDRPKRCAFRHGRAKLGRPNPVAELLCDGATDTPGKTCDKPVCKPHAKEVGADRHLCPDCVAAGGRIEVQQGKLFDSDLSSALRDAGIRASSASAPAEWKEVALLAVRRCAQLHADFIVDEVWKWIPEGYETPNGKSMGGIMTKAKGLGWITNTHRSQPTAQVKSHGQPRNIWHSELYGRRAS